MLKLRGFTFIELLIGIAILAIVITFSIPYTTYFYQKNQSDIILYEIKQAIEFAKNQALVSGKNLILTPLHSSHDWSEGMLLFVDNATHQFSEKDDILYEWHWSYPSIHVSWQGFKSSQYLQFNVNASQNTLNGSFIISDALGHTNRLVINRFGRTRWG